MDHDQSFKNLILDYPRESIAFFAPTIAALIPPDAIIRPLREELQKERLPDRFEELDTPLMVEFPDGAREAIVFDFEEHTEPSTFRIERLARYCLGIAEMVQTRRIVPVVIFLKKGNAERTLAIGIENETFLSFRYLVCDLPRIDAANHLDSQNLVARLNLPNMQHDVSRHLDVATSAMNALAELEKDHEKRRKYRDFVEQYARLTREEWRQWRASLPREANMMWSRIEEEEKLAAWKAEGIALGMAEGEALGKAKGKAEGAAQICVRMAADGVLPAAVARREIARLVAEDGLPPDFAAAALARLGSP